MLIERFFKKYEFVFFFILFFYIINLLLYLNRFDIINKIGFIVIIFFYVIYFYKFYFFKNFKKRFFIYILLFYFAFIVSNFLYIKIHFEINYEAIYLKDIKHLYLFSTLLILGILFILKKFKLHTKIRYFYSIFILTFFFCIFFIYLFLSFPLSTIDTYYTKFLPYSVLYEKDININELDNSRYINKYHLELYYPGTKHILGKDKNSYPVFPLLPGFLHFLIVLAEKLLGLPIASLNYPYIYINSTSGWVLHYFEPHQVERINASLIAVFTAYLFYLLLLKFPIKKFKALYYTGIYSLASIHFSISANNLWQHTFIEFFNILLLLIWIKYFQKENQKSLFIIGLLEGLLFYIRPTTIFISIILNLFFLIINFLIIKKNHLKSLVHAISLVLLGAFLMIIPMATLNLSIYDHPLGGYGRTVSNQNSTDVIFVFDKFFWNLLGLLFSPNYGFFVFHSYILIALLYFFYDKFKSKNEATSPNIQLLLYSSFFCILIYLIFYSFNQQWSGMYNYGTRMLTDVLVYFFILLVIAIEKISNKKWFYIFNIFVIISVIIQFYGNLSLNLLGDWYCDNHERKYHYKDVERNVWKIDDPLFLHKIYYRSKPLYFNEVIYPGYKMCSLYFRQDEKENQSLRIDKEMAQKHKDLIPLFLRINQNQDLPEGDLLFSYYFFTNKNDLYCLKIEVFNPLDQNQEITLYIKNSQGDLYKETYNILPKENFLYLPLKKTSRNFLFAFSKNYSEFLLRNIAIYKKEFCRAE